MKRPLWIPIQVASAGLLTISAVLASDWIGITDVQPVVMNTTHSMPAGVYVRTFKPIKVGSVVAVPLPAVMHEYVSAYPAWSAFFKTHPLLKIVIAIEGNIICRDAATGDFEASGLFLGVAASRGPDGRPLPSWAGCRALTTGEIAVFGELPDSLDSRYFGPVPVALARTYQMLWTW